MASHSSAGVCETPHANQTNHTTRTATVVNDLKQRALAILNDRTIDPQSKAVIRYALEINDPWLAELVRRADAGEEIFGAIDFSETPESSTNDAEEEKIEALAEMICRAGDDTGTKSAALLVLMGTLENASHPKALANLAKQIAFTRCGELNHNGIVDKQIAVLEGELLSRSTVEC